jgi:hypothetical protein
VGFILPWGPVIWGLITAFLGFGIGYGIYHAYSSKRNIKHSPEKLPELTLIVRCGEAQSALVHEIMWTYRALTVGCAHTADH